MTTLSKAGRYELHDELGRGAMGVVYKATDPVIGRSVAVKTMRLSEAGTGMTHEELIARFQTEARAAGLLTHPNIVVIYDAGEEEGLFYITMEMVEGRSLQALIDAGQTFPLPRMLRILEQTCSALEFAHQRNVVHRDIKPANLMLTSDDTVKVTDFGTAKILQFGTAQTAHVVGTPSYMSPEQIKGKSVDGRSDLFALGVILYELVTGEKPFPGQNITTVIYKIVNEDPIPPRELDSSVHPGLNYVITRALAKEPEARYQSARELLEALRNYREQGGSPAATVALPTRVAAVATAAPQATPDRSEASTGTADVAESPHRKRSSPVVALFLLALIAGASYRLGPYMRDIWERGRAARAHSSAPASAPQTAPAAQPPATVPETAAASREEPREEPKPAEPKSSEEKPAETKPVAPAPAKTPVARKAEVSLPPSPEAMALKSRMEQKLAEAGLADQVHLKVAGSTITISGRLNPRQHSALLHQLANAPASVRVIDHIEYADDAPSGAASSDERPRPTPGRGEIEVLTDVIGATAVLHGPYGRVLFECRTPCRFDDLWPATYTVEVNQPGYQPVQRKLQVRAGGIVDERIEMQPAGPAQATQSAGSSTLYVTSRPNRARVFINGQRQADATPATIRLAPGTYNIVVRKQGFETYFGQVQIKPNEPAQLDIELAPQRQNP